MGRNCYKLSTCPAKGHAASQNHVYFATHQDQDIKAMICGVVSGFR